MPFEQIAFICHRSNQMLGVCDKATAPDRHSSPQAVATCSVEGIYGELVTDATFSCCNFNSILEQTEK